MKIIGSMFTWNNLEFFKCALEQALEFCDEVVLSEGCHSKKYPIRSTDGTCEYIETIKDHPRIRFVEFKERTHPTYDLIMLQMRKEHPKLSPLYKPGNWILCCDDDLFFFRKDWESLKEAMQSPPEDQIIFPSRQFFYNFRFNVFEGRRGGVFAYRIRDDLRLVGTGSPYYKSGGRFTMQVLPRVTAFHYGHIKKVKRMKARWVMSVEKGTKSSVGCFKDWMSVSWKEDDDIFNSEDIIEGIRAYKGGLNIYTGEHPEFVANHPWRNIDDVRRLGC